MHLEREVWHGVVADPRAAVRESLRYYLQSHARVIVDAEIAAGMDLVRYASQARLDFAVVSLPMSGPAPEELVRRLRLAAPRCRIIVLLGAGVESAAGRLAYAEGDVLLNASASMDEIVHAITSTIRIWPRNPSPVTAALSQRQIEVLRLMAAGLTNPQIAHALHLSRHTVKRHVADIFDNLRVGGRMAAVNSAISVGLLEPPAHDAIAATVQASQ